MSASPVVQTSVQIRWKREIANAECLAIIYAIEHGYCTCDSLICALPQFSKTRIEEALSTLFATQLVSQQIDKLILSPDAILIDEITMSPNFYLPIAAHEITIPFMLAVFKQLGIENPGLALDTVIFLTPKHQ
ncbi:hypothetical protein C5F63_05750 [Photobacterium damselae subsp. damselae]|uniref:hypothetical protein n=1 Tax=Photobacterium damselae TaxID=38293 RepID=UPI000D08128C|nr:hypothetical protein [Photobacterium damselae]PSB89160.1 hypothetical protein C5F63_05750 [Photobacterium damselae subsp. damselae]